MSAHTDKLKDGTDTLICMQRRGVRSLGALYEHARRNGHLAVKLLLNVKGIISTHHTIIESRG
jgi:hypothetical protein